MLAAKQASVALHKKKKEGSSGYFTLTLYLLVVLALYLGWRVRDQHLIMAEEGIGYLLGIVGGSMMLLLLLYPLRKHYAQLRFLGPIKHLFRLHMFLGVLGPVLVLFHANFSIGALNSNVALFCMLIVAGSGLLGRYFYSRLHNGLYGHKLTVQQLLDESEWHFDALMGDGNYYPTLSSTLKTYETRALNASEGVLSVIKVPFLSFCTLFIKRWLTFKCWWEIRKHVEDKKIRILLYRKTKINLRRYFAAIRRMAGLGFYCRLFSLWHMLHMPLFIMMLITGVVHVLAVHMY